MTWAASPAGLLSQRENRRSRPSPRSLSKPSIQQAPHRLGARDVAAGRSRPGLAWLFPPHGREQQQRHVPPELRFASLPWPPSAPASLSSLSLPSPHGFLPLVQTLKTFLLCEEQGSGVRGLGRCWPRSPADSRRKGLFAHLACKGTLNSYKGSAGSGGAFPWQPRCVWSALKFQRRRLIRPP